MALTWIPLAECIPRGVYQVHSRNLDQAVFDGKTGFIGLRDKFSSRFLDTEYHFDVGPNNYGTLRPISLIEMLPVEIGMHERLPGSWDDVTGRCVAFDYERKTKSEETGIGWGWYFVGGWEDPEEEDPERKIKASGRYYNPLHDYMQDLLERTYGDKAARTYEELIAKRKELT
jgi:hypothetical protein